MTVSIILDTLILIPTILIGLAIPTTIVAKYIWQPMYIKSDKDLRDFIKNKPYYLKYPIYDSESDHTKEPDDTDESDDTKEQDLADLFSVFGNIKRVFIVTDKMTKRSKGFGFVSYFNKEDAKRGLENINGIAYDNLILQVEYSIDRDN